MKDSHINIEENIVRLENVIGELEKAKPSSEESSVLLGEVSNSIEELLIQLQDA